MGRDEYRSQDGGSVVTGGGRRGGWVGGGFYVLLSTSPRYFLSHSHLQYLWQLNVSQETEWKVEVQLLKIVSYIRSVLLHTY